MKVSSNCCYVSERENSLLLCSPAKCFPQFPTDALRNFILLYPTCMRSPCFSVWATGSTGHGVQGRSPFLVESFVFPALLRDIAAWMHLRYISCPSAQQKQTEIKIKNKKSFFCVLGLFVWDFGFTHNNQWENLP